MDIAAGNLVDIDRNYPVILSDSATGQEGLRPLASKNPSHYTVRVELGLEANTCVWQMKNWSIILVKHPVHMKHFALVNVMNFFFLCLRIWIDEWKPIIPFWTQRERPEIIQSLRGCCTAIVIVGKRCIEVISFTSCAHVLDNRQNQHDKIRLKQIFLSLLFF